MNTSKNSIPKKFTENMEWMDCKATLFNFLKSQPGRNGVPLNYIIRDNVDAIVPTKAKFLDDYVDRTPLIGRFLMPMHTKYIHTSPN